MFYEQTARRYLVLALLTLAIGHAFGALIRAQELPSSKVSAVESKLAQMGRYMEEDISGKCHETTFPNWDSFPLIQCTYRQPDKKAGAKQATVIMLNPSRSVLARWIVATCVIVQGMPTVSTGAKFESCTNKLRRTILGASGAQFPVAGIVLEDQYGPNGPDGIQEVYTFRDGLTVEVKGGLPVAFTGAFGKDEIAISLDANREITRARNFARIQSSSRKDYLDYFGKKAEPVEGPLWGPVIRKHYQDAWKRAHSNDPETVDKYRNDLMVATCYRILHKKPPSQ